ncbi:MAG: prolyl oligopeptidase family serine peptidase [Kineosporiaceae bacterium]
MTDASPAAEGAQPPATPFGDLDAYLALPRLSGLALSPDGTRLVVGAAALVPDATRYVSALWEVDPTGSRPARRLTRGTKGAGNPVFAPDGSLLFLSARPDPDAKDSGDDDPPALWVLPVDGGEARVLARRPGGIGDVKVAVASGTVVVTSDTLPHSVTAEDDEQRRKARKERKVSALLHESYPVRYWDHDLGPGQTRLLTAAWPEGLDEATLELRDLTPAPGRALDELGYDVSPDGAWVATSWQVLERGGRRESLALLDVATGTWRLLLDDPAREYGSPRFSPDGSKLAVTVFGRPSDVDPPSVVLGVADLTGLQPDAQPEVRVLTGAWDRWPSDPVWSPDSSTIYVTADDDGRAPVFAVDVATGEVTRLTGDHGAYSDVQVSADGAYLYAMRSAVDSPALPVRLNAGTPVQQPVTLQAPAAAPALPGTLTEIETTTGDGVRQRAWLCLPDGASAENPVPLLLWIHGGPLSSWNSWSWRWNPWLAVAQGYAVVLPDPALSLGYGQDFIKRGWGRWGAEPYQDLMDVTDAVEARPDIDATRVAAMGGSFGGYMANWVAGHTDRFLGIVSHASLWALDQFGPTTDAYDYWRREMTPPMAAQFSPHQFVDKIVTPMLVVHGDRDYRVPIGEGLRLWAELAERGGEDGVMPHKFLYYPDENHWVLQPQHAKVWYDTVFAFLAHTVLGRDWVVPEILR